MDRREFLKKAGIGGAGLALGLSGASAFFNNQDSSSKKAYDGDEDISFYGKHQAGITTPMQKACYLVVLDLHTTDKKRSDSAFLKTGQTIVVSWSRRAGQKRWGQCPLAANRYR